MYLVGSVEFISSGSFLGHQFRFVCLPGFEEIRLGNSPEGCVIFASPVLGLLIGDLFFQDFQNLGKIGNCIKIRKCFVTIWTFFKSRNNREVNVDIYGGERKSRKIWRTKKCAKELWKLWEKSSPIRKAPTRSIPGISYQGICMPYTAAVTQQQHTSIYKTSIKE